MPICEKCNTYNKLQNKMCEKCGKKMPIDVDDIGNASVDALTKISNEEKNELAKILFPNGMPEPSQIIVNPKLEKSIFDTLKKVEEIQRIKHQLGIK